jgi:Coenzyme PQQ synthesis protein D (PqqD)
VAGQVYRRAAKLMEADVGDELLALDPERGHCIGFNEVAAWVWRRLAEPASFDQLRDGLLAEYEVDPNQCAAELRELLDELVKRGLIAGESKVS